MEKKGAKAGAAEMLTANQLAKEWGLVPTEVRKRLKEAGIKADSVRCGCSYYDRARSAEIKKKAGL